MEKNLRIFAALFLAALFAFSSVNAQTRKKRTASPGINPSLADSVFSGIKLRSIGPAFMSGRIADIAIHPENENIWYVAVGSGGVWKTKNAGVTWAPIFDGQSSYSIGCVSIDTNNPHIIWVGTGENVGGRHVGFGDGIYRSKDGGSTWTNMGLKKSEHISKIIVHPENSDVIWVAAQGPLWSAGGDRGLYKSIDGGMSWQKTLGDSQWTGVTDLVIDPRNPDRLYAATWQRHRTVAAYMGGGPKTGLHRSLDGGETWESLTNGIPNQNLGKIGLTISPQNPDVIYAAIEMELKKGGVFRSVDRGSTWEKRSNAVTGGTGPHYYQELYASPHYEGKLYLVDNTMQVSDDGGKTFYRLNRKAKHGDNHAIAFKKSDKDYLLVGTDGGVYETFDLGDNWRYMENLPLTQFYKVAVDDAEPFYNIYGGTQDNSTPGGPSRTDNVHGIRTADWKLVLNWDGHQPATEPGNPDIMYAERQQGQLSRIDLITGEALDIQPQPAIGEKTERFNWDAPILVSPHNPTTIYFASNRVWKSENRGDQWTSISGDLTKNQDRITLPIMGKTQSWNNAWDVYAMSNYNTITSLAESPVQKGLLYAGTDDGIIQVSENEGTTWKRINVSNMPGVPSAAFVNDIKADLFDAKTVYVCLDNHKNGDFRPFLMKSTDKGVTWKSIASNLPKRTLVWRLAQDHENPKLLFLATEFGVYFTIDGGSQWSKLTGGVPTISFRDLAIQRRENDLVGATFGRGFYILDDYSFLREVTTETLKKKASLFETRDALWYIPRPVISFNDKKGSQGSEHFVADNPPFGAVFTYYLKDSLKTKIQVRLDKEKMMANQNIPFPGWDELENERMESDPGIWLLIKDEKGKVVRRVKGSNQQGFNRVNWDLRYPSKNSIDLSSTPTDSKGVLAAPGKFTATLMSDQNGVLTQLDEPIEFRVVPLRPGALKGATPEEYSTFWKEYYQAFSRFESLSKTLKNTLIKVESMEIALERSTSDFGEIDKSLKSLKKDLLEIDVALHGNGSKRIIGEKTLYPLKNRLSTLRMGMDNSTYGPTETHKESLVVANGQLNGLKTQIQQALETVIDISKTLKEAGAPWVEGDSLWQD